MVSVPAGMKHSFDCGEPPALLAIQLFMNPSGWVPLDTDSRMEDGHSW
jgi:cupin superfamily acireductone dioxygenase involved in methionine salvage